MLIHWKQIVFGGAGLSAAAIAYVVLQSARRREIRNEEIFAALLSQQEELLRMQRRTLSGNSSSSMERERDRDGPILSLLQEDSAPSTVAANIAGTGVNSTPTTPTTATSNTNRSFDLTLQTLSAEWSKLRDIVLGLNHAATSYTNSPASSGLISQRSGRESPDDADCPLITPGVGVRVRRLCDVHLNTLWDSSNNKYCSREGVVSRVDVDGDVRVDFEDGDFFVVDSSFLVVVRADGVAYNTLVPPPNLLPTLWAVDRLIQKLRTSNVTPYSHVAPGAMAVSNSVTPLQTHVEGGTRRVNNGSLTPFSVMVAMHACET